MSLHGLDDWCRLLVILTTDLEEASPPWLVPAGVVHSGFLLGAATALVMVVVRASVANEGSWLLVLRHC